MALPAFNSWSPFTHEFSYQKIEAQRRKNWSTSPSTLDWEPSDLFLVRMSTNRDALRVLHPQSRRFVDIFRQRKVLWRPHHCSKMLQCEHLGQSSRDGQLQKPAQAGLAYLLSTSLHQFTVVGAFSTIPPLKINSESYLVSANCWPWICPRCLQTHDRRTLPLLRFRRCMFVTRRAEIILILRLFSESLFYCSSNSENPSVHNWWIYYFSANWLLYKSHRNALSAEGSWFPCSMTWPSLRTKKFLSAS